ncbi:hypothetical protein DEU56DRAFT_751970 [Suillus clintonianus]|uniref:uncharacterized protein n=1 Tax=Suillus clintonianus TaxID=1904413 RepID=UPI001B864420|nr:uncharacterized protein DEU56DRAFT_751970 [Suillus clintonianus]KAG2153390.1 hypothetical protein DEU56DRAFT_751970 [Suillus clintonianus]
MDSIINSQAVFGDELQAIATNNLDTISSSAPTQEYSTLLYGSGWVTNTMSDVVDLPLGQLPPGLDLLFASSVSHELFTPVVPGHVKQTISGSSARRYQHLCLPIVLGGQEKLKCTWLGCSSILKKDSHTRHVEEVHFRTVKAICTRCEREFTRTYAKKKHELTCPEHLRPDSSREINFRYPLGKTFHARARVASPACGTARVYTKFWVNVLGAWADNYSECSVESIAAYRAVSGLVVPCGWYTGESRPNADPKFPNEVNRFNSGNGN